jgi:hypothetical protein
MNRYFLVTSAFLLMLAGCMTTTTSTAPDGTVTATSTPVWATPEGQVAIQQFAELATTTANTLNEMQTQPDMPQQTRDWKQLLLEAFAQQVPVMAEQYGPDIITAILNATFPQATRLVPESPAP